MQYHSKKHNEISAQVADKDGRIWLGTYHEGIMRSDQPYAKSRPLNFSPVGNQNEVPVFCAIKDSCSNPYISAQLFREKGKLLYSGLND